MAAARSIADTDQHAQALANVAIGMADSGQHEDAADVIAEAVATARSVKPGSAGHPLAGAARALAAGGKHDEAIDVARSISDPFTRAMAFIAVARVSAAAGRQDEATDAAELAVSTVSTSQVLLKEMALGQAATLFYSIGDVPRCGDTTAQILISRKWQEAIPALARLDPPALMSVAAQVHQMVTQTGA